MFQYDSDKISACEIDAQKQHLQKKRSKTSFQTLGTLGKVKEHRVGHSTGFCMKDFEKKYAGIIHRDKYMPAPHSTNNSQSLNDNSRAFYPQEKSQDATREGHA